MPVAVKLVQRRASQPAGGARRSDVPCRNTRASRSAPTTSKFIRCWGKGSSAARESDGSSDRRHPTTANRSDYVPLCRLRRVSIITIRYPATFTCPSPGPGLSQRRRRWLTPDKCIRTDSVAVSRMKTFEADVSKNRLVVQVSFVKTLAGCVPQLGGGGRESNPPDRDTRSHWF